VCEWAVLWKALLTLRPPLLMHPHIADSKKEKRTLSQRAEITMATLSKQITICCLNNQGFLIICNSPFFSFSDFSALQP